MGLWSVIESAPKAAAASAWHQWLGPEFGAAAALFLHKTDRKVDRVPCPHGCGCAHVVPPRVPLVGVCECEDSDCEDIQVREEDLVVWEVDLEKLGQKVARALELPRRDRATSETSAREIGMFGGDGVPVVLVVARGSGDMERVVAQLVARLKGRFALLGPTNRFMTVAGRELLAGVGARFFDVESNFDVAASGALVARKKAGVLFGALVPETEAELSDEELRKIYARLLLSAKDAKGSREAPMKDVFDLYCLKAFSAREVAIKLGCSKATVMNRLQALNQLAGVPAKDLRAYKPFFEQMEKDLSDPRAKRVRRKDAAYGGDPEDGGED